tara:strand:+ start:342 stop:1004 length:663 start_codon:yes stop_codon:yes gene_type:complete
MPIYSDKKFSSLVPRLNASVPGCPQPIIEQYIRDAAIEACERTLAWRYIQPKIRLTTGVYDYPYEAPNNSEVHAFLTATVNDTKLKPVTLDHLHDLYPTWPDFDSTDYTTPRCISQLDPDNFIVAPTPDDITTYDLRMVVALKPLRTATDMDTSIFDELENIIMHGALQHLLVLPERTWTDRELGAYHAKQFSFKIAERRARANIGNARASMRISNQPFG